jgi:ATP-dependent DNA ligase
VSDALPNYVQEYHAKPSNLDLSLWLANNPLPTICEPKYEGIRVFLFKSGDNLVVSGKIGSIYTPASTPTVFLKVPELVHAPKRMILDGEYVSKDGLHLFDILNFDDRDLRPLPLYRRKEILNQVLGGVEIETRFITAESTQDIEKYREEILSKGREGIIAKNPMSFYGEPDTWLKIKRFDTFDCFVIDYGESSDRKRTWSIGAYDASGKIVILGEVSSFVEGVDPKKIRLGSVIEVRFNLVENKFRASFILRVRRDKTASECLITQIPQFQLP